MYMQRQTNLEQKIFAILSTYVSNITAKSLVRTAMKQSRSSAIAADISPALEQSLLSGLKLYCPNPSKINRCQAQLKTLATGNKKVIPKEETLFITNEDHILVARRRTRQLAIELGFANTTQVSLVTVVSELSRNIWRYAGAGRIRLEPIFAPKSGIRIIAIDNGPGIPNISEILDGQYQSKTGMGLGLLGCQRLMDQFEIETNAGLGTEVRVLKYL